MAKKNYAGIIALIRQRIKDNPPPPPTPEEEAQYALRRKIQAVTDHAKFALDTRGHSPRKYDASEIRNSMESALELLPETERERLLAAIQTQMPLDQAIPVFLNLSLETCCFCEGIDYLTDGLRISATAPCPHPEGFSLVVRVAIPSGIMVVGERMDDHFTIYGDGWGEASLHWEADYTRRCAMLGYAQLYSWAVHHAGLYRKNEDAFFIADPDWSSEDGLRKPSEEMVAEVPGDHLMFTTIIDRDLFVSMGGPAGVRREAEKLTEVSCKPGVYEFTHHVYRQVWRDSIDDPDRKEPLVLTDIRWIGPIGTPCDKVDGLDDRQLSAGQIYAYLWNQGRHHLRCYTRSVVTVIEYMLVTPHAAHWHKNGFPEVGPGVRDDSPSVEIPNFHSPMPHQIPDIWPGSALHAAAHGRIPLNESFKELVERYLVFLTTYARPTNEKNVEAVVKKAHDLLDAFRKNYR